MNAPSVARICRRLDHIPLAIELAAARVRTFPPEQLADRLGDAFDLLTGPRTALPRQQTLRATIDWSYRLLPPEEQGMLRQLSVFAGGWTLTAAEAVCAGVGVPVLLDQLVNKSLVNADDGAPEARYAMLETVRQYAHEKLTAAGEHERARQPPGLLCRPGRVRSGAPARAAGVGVAGPLRRGGRQPARRPGVVRPDG